MRRGWKILIAAVVALAGLLVLNAVATDRETRPSEVVFDGAEIIELQSGGSLQVRDTPASEPAPEGALPPSPVVLLHGYTGALDWWDEVAPELPSTHRVVEIDLLGHGGSAKPSSGYEVGNQADLIAEALNQLGVEGAVVVGHSLGGVVATALAERSSELVDRLVVIGMAPEAGGQYGGLDLRSEISRAPLIGQALHRLGPRPLKRMGMEQGFAPDFPIPDFAVADLERMTYTAFSEWPGASEAYTSERPLDERIEESLLPALIIFGAEDRIFDAEASLEGYAELTAAQTELIEGAGHTPQLEAPEETAELIEEFAAPLPDPDEGASGDRSASPPRSGRRGNAGNRRRDPRQRPGASGDRGTGRAGGGAGSRGATGAGGSRDARSDRGAGGDPNARGDRDAGGGGDPGPRRRPGRTEPPR